MLRLWGHADPESNPASLCPGYVTSSKTLPVSKPHVPLPRLKEDQLGQQGESCLAQDKRPTNNSLKIDNEHKIAPENSVCCLNLVPITFPMS